MDPNPLVALSSARMATRLLKQNLVAREGIGADVPFTIVTTRGPVPIGVYDGEGDNAEIAATVHMAVTMSDCDTVLYLGELYIEPGGDHEPGVGELAHRFAHGDPRVKEAIAVTAVHRSGHLRSIFDPYHYEGRTVVWDPLSAPYAPAWRDFHERSLLRSMGDAFEVQAQRPGPPALRPGSHLHRIGSESINDHEMLVSFALCSPCPCGSGRTMNECCRQNN